MARKKAVVSGAGTGIGRAVALVLAGAGYDVVLSYHGSREGAESAVREIEEEGGSALAVKEDLTRPDDVRDLFSRAEAFLGGLDLYVNNAGVTMKSAFSRTTPELFDTLVSVDMKSAYFCVQEAANLMAARKTKGSIVVITSNNAFLQHPGVSVYGMVKAALVKMVRHAAVEYARDGIRINAIAPGWTRTERVMREADEKAVVKGIPLGRMLEPEEVGRMILFLASPAALSVTGNCLVADGGVTLLSASPADYGIGG